MLLNTLELVRAAIARSESTKEYIANSTDATVVKDYYSSYNNYVTKLSNAKVQFEKDIEAINRVALGLSHSVNIEFFFGSDLTNTIPLRDYILSSKYVKDIDYKIYCEMNDLTSGPNSIVIMNYNMLSDTELLALIGACNGSGSFNGDEQ